MVKVVRTLLSRNHPGWRWRGEGGYSRQAKGLTMTEPLVVCSGCGTPNRLPRTRRANGRAERLGDVSLPLNSRHFHRIDPDAAGMFREGRESGLAVRYGFSHFRRSG